MLSGQPFDTAKVKMQTFPTMYRGFIHCFTSTFRQVGLSGLYKGSTPALIANISENAVLFLSYGLCQDAIRFMSRMDKGAHLRLDSYIYMHLYSGIYILYAPQLDEVRSNIWTNLYVQIL